MGEFIELLIKIIRLDMFIGYGLFTLGYILISLFVKKSKLMERLDLAANQLIGIVGIVYFSGVVILTSVAMIAVEDYHFRWVPVVQVSVWIGITQLLWLERIRKSILIRITFALLLIVSFETAVIVMTSFYRDYQPWQLFAGISVSEILIGLGGKTLLFCILAIIYLIGKDKLKTKKAI